MKGALPLRIYIAARYGRRDEAFDLEQVLLPLGVEITSTWIHQTQDEMAYEQGIEETTRLAEKDVAEIKRSDMLVYLSEEETNTWGRGGRHVEFGIAVARAKMLCVIGPKENLFHYLPEVQHFDSVDDFIDFVREEVGNDDR